jgi:hypothetical protein
VKQLAAAAMEKVNGESGVAQRGDMSSNLRGYLHR